MAVPEVDKKLLAQLASMGFPLARAARALHFSGDSSLETAINWLVDNENDPDIDQMPLVPVTIEIGRAENSFLTDNVTLKAQELRDKERGKKEKEESKLDRQREKERIHNGKKLVVAKKIDEENERNRYLAQWKVEKEEESRARDRIRQKLQQDKEERRQRLGLPPMETGPSEPATFALKDKTVSSGKLFLTRTVTPASRAKVGLLRDCLISLKHNTKDNDARLKRAFQTLFVYVRNAARYPEDAKYRTIRLSNPAFQDRVGAFREGIEFLEMCGFKRFEGGEFLYLPRDEVDMAVLRSAANELRSAVTNPFFGLLSKRERSDS